MKKNEVLTKRELVKKLKFGKGLRQLLAQIACDIVAERKARKDLKTE